MCVRDYLTEFMTLFEARTDIHAEGYPKKANPNKYSYQCVEEPLTADIVALHLDGARHIGVYPATADNRVSWFAVDFDGPKDSDPSEAFVMALRDARAQVAKFADYGLKTYVERSRSGSGVHVWGFLTETVDAGILLSVIKPLLLDGVMLDRVFPVQKDVRKKGKKGYGNLIALPYNGLAVKFGNSMFLTEDNTPIPLNEFLANVEKIPTDEIVARAPAQPMELPEELRSQEGDFDFESATTTSDDFAGRPTTPLVGVLKLISEYGCRFMNHAWEKRHTLPETAWWVALGQLTAFQNGRAAAHLISKDYRGYSADETNQKFDNLMQNPPHGCAYIHEHFPKLACKGCPMKAPYHQADKTILELVQESSAPMRKADLKQHLTRVRRRDSGTEKSGTTVGIEGLDKIVQFRPSELTVIGAMPSMGKTAMLIDSALNVAKSGVPALVFSAETAEGGLYDRILAHEADVDSLALRGERRSPETGEIQPLTELEWSRIEQATELINALPLFVNFTDINAEQVLNNVERVLLENMIPLDSPYVVYFDYLQFGAKLGQETNYERISRLSTEFKNIAKITKHPVVIFSQLVRSAEDMESPSLTMFKESGRIEQDADVAMILSGLRVEGKMAPRRITVVKQREGESQGAVDYILQQHVCRFKQRRPEGQAQDRPDLLAEDRPELFGT